MYINVNQIIYAPADVSLTYTTPLHSLLFRFSHEQHHLPYYFGYFVKFPDQSFYTQKDSQMNLYYRFI